MEKLTKLNTTNLKFEVNNLDLDSRFVQASLNVMYTGKNLNGSQIEKSVVEDCIESIKNVPIVAEFIVDEDGNCDFGGHGGEYYIDENNNLSFRNTTIPIGLIPESATTEFKIITDSEGIEREYLVVHGALLWASRYEKEIELLKNAEIPFSQSMEILVSDGKYDKKEQSYMINSFKFNGLCLLGTSVQPCFADANIQLYSSVNTDSFKSEFSEMLIELKQMQYSLSNDSINTNNNEKGEDSMLKKLLEKYSITQEMLEEKIANFSELSEEELEVKAEEVFGVQEPEPTPVPEPEDIEPKPENTDEEKFILSYELSHEDVRSQLYSLLEAYVLMHQLGSRWDFWLSAVYDDYFIALGDKKNYKISYTKDNDIIVLGDYVEVFVQYLTVEQKESLESMQSEFELVKEGFELAKAELVELQEFKQNTEKAIHEAQAEELFAQSGLEESEIEDIKSDVHSFSLDQIEEKLLAKIGRKTLNGKKFSKQKDGAIRIPVGNSDTHTKQNHPYGDLFD